MPVSILIVVASGPVGADVADQFAALDRHVDVIDGDLLHEAGREQRAQYAAEAFAALDGAEGLAQISRFDDGHRLPALPKHGSRECSRAACLLHLTETCLSKREGVAPDVVKVAGPRVLLPAPTVLLLKGVECTMAAKKKGAMKKKKPAAPKKK